MSTLYICYSPKGEKFELSSRANYLDCITHHGFTTTPPSGFVAEPIDESEIEDENEFSEDEVQRDDQEQESEEAPSEAADEGQEEEVVIEQEALAFESAADAKAYLREKGVQFDGRLSLADLTDLANGKAA